MNILESLDSLQFDDNLIADDEIQLVIADRDALEEELDLLLSSKWMIRFRRATSMALW